MKIIQQLLLSSSPTTITSTRSYPPRGRGLPVSEPRTVREALSGPHATAWLAAIITSGLTSMQSHEVYDLAPPPPDINSFRLRLGLA